MSLAIKYRPKDFSEFAGNEKEIEIVKNYLKTKYPSTTLIKGRTGSGKTTLARIIAKETTCLNPSESGSCNTCFNCKSNNSYIETGEIKDNLFVNEVDCAKLRGVEDVEKIIDDMLKPSLYDNKRVWILDEVHKLSSTAQNALLKILEETPEDIIVILITTDDEDLIDTLKGRMTITLHISLISSDVVKRLEEVANAEGIEHNKEALKIIANRENNILRQALNSLENIFKLNRIVNYDNTLKFYGDVDTKIYFDLMKSLSENNISKYLLILDDIKNDVGFDKFYIDFISFITRSFYIKYNIDTNVSKTEMLKTKELFETFTINDLTVIINFINSIDLNKVEFELINLFLLLNQEEDLNITKGNLINKDIQEVNVETNEPTDIMKNNQESEEYIKEEKAKKEQEYIENIEKLFKEEVGFEDLF